MTTEDYNRLAEFLVSNVADGDLPTSADFGKFSEMVSCFRTQQIVRSQGHC